MSCSTKSIDCIDDEEYLLHHCPEDGHGICPICFDFKVDENTALDY
jgi:hypothetical protein